METANALSEQINQTYKAIDEAKSKITKNDIHLQELKSKLEDISKKSSAVQTEKEVKALQLEEEIAKEQIAFANEEIERFDAIASSKNEEIDSLKSQLSEEEESIKELQEEVDKNIAELNTQREEVAKSRAELVPQIDAKILTFYEKVKRWAKQTAVVPVRKQACYGCYMKINDKTYTEVLKSEEIVNCPHCGRILYKEIEEA